MLSETDLTLFDQAWIVLALMVTATLAMLAGVQIERAERERRDHQREIEDAAMRQATVRNVRDIVI